MAVKPCSKMDCLKEIQSGKVTSDAARVPYTVKMEVQNGQCLLRVVISGRRGAGLASSTLRLVM